MWFFVCVFFLMFKLRRTNKFKWNLMKTRECTASVYFTSQLGTNQNRLVNCFLKNRTCNKKAVKNLTTVTLPGAWIIGRLPSCRERRGKLKWIMAGNGENNVLFFLIQPNPNSPFNIYWALRIYLVTNINQLKLYLWATKNQVSYLGFFGESQTSKNMFLSYHILLRIWRQENHVIGLVIFLPNSYARV